MPYQTTANSNAFLMGSCVIYISGSTDKSTTTGSFLNLGSARGVKLTESWDSYEIETDNTPTVIKGAKNQAITVEGNLLELNFEKFNLMRGGLSSWSTATFTLNTGGSLTITPQAIFLKHTANGATSTETIYATIYYAALQEGFTIPFPGDDKTDVAEMPFKFKGVCQSTRAAGSQLFKISDGRSLVYTTYSTLAP
jgi:hypothetical protein